MPLRYRKRIASHLCENDRISFNFFRSKLEVSISHLFLPADSQPVHTDYRTDLQPVPHRRLQLGVRSAA